MEKEIFEKYIKAGKILREIKKEAKKQVKEGAKILDIAEKLENKIKEMGGKPAFPLNISINEIAAHYTPEENEETIIKETDLVKIDIGVHIDGYIADSAISINIANNHAKLIEASQQALENVKSILKIGVSLKEIGKEIEQTIKRKGFNPISNLSGHFLEKYIPHFAPSIPNIENNLEFEIKDGAFAIEPFATSGRGFVREYGRTDIFSLESVKPIRNPNARKIMKHIEEEYKTLPFAERWLQIGISKFSRDFALRELINNGNLRQYPVLKEKYPVSQTEDSFIIYNEEIIQYT